MRIYCILEYYIIFYLYRIHDTFKMHVYSMYYLFFKISYHSKTPKIQKSNHLKYVTSQRKLYFINN